MGLIVTLTQKLVSQKAYNVGLAFPGLDKITASYCIWCFGLETYFL